MAGYMPGLSVIRDRLITPLLVATEKVVEQYIPIPVATVQNPEEA
jgi:hypothetical protein